MGRIKEDRGLDLGVIMVTQHLDLRSVWARTCDWPRWSGSWEGRMETRATGRRAWAGKSGDTVWASSFLLNTATEGLWAAQQLWNCVRPSLEIFKTLP